MNRGRSWSGRRCFAERSWSRDTGNGSITNVGDSRYYQPKPMTAIVEAVGDNAGSQNTVAKTLISSTTVQLLPLKLLLLMLLYLLLLLLPQRPAQNIIMTTEISSGDREDEDSCGDGENEVEKANKFATITSAIDRNVCYVTDS